MKRKIMLIIILVLLVLSFLPAFAVNNSSNITMPVSEYELGYIFTTDGLNNSNTPDEYRGISVISEELNIYYAADFKSLENIMNKFNVICWEEDFKIEVAKKAFDVETGLKADSVLMFSNEIPQNIEVIDNENTSSLNDPFYEQMWHYDAVKARVFRDNGIDGRGVKVGIIDSGLTKQLEKFPEFCDFDNVDIRTGVNVCAYIEQARPEYEDENRLDCTEDNEYHGTSVASIICAKGNNNYGIAGLVDGCTVIPYKIEDYYYGNDNTWLRGSALMRAIELAYQDDCDVINISWGGEGASVSTSLNRIVDNCIQNGMIIMAASGNSGKTTNDIEYPAACDNVIGVGATRPNCEGEFMCFDGTTGLLKEETEATPQDFGIIGYHRGSIANFPDDQYVRTELSTANETVFVCAPGVNIPAVNCSEIAKRPFTSFLGTSAATPIVSSAAIGVKQMRPYVDTDMFKEILKATAVDLEDEGYDVNTGYGMVNFERIYNYVSQMPMTAPERTTDISIDYEKEQLIGFPLNRDYTVNGKNVAVSEDGTLQISEEWFGTTIEIVKKASSEAYTDSKPQELVIPERPESPKVELLEDKYIKGIGSDIWYKEENEANWQNGYDSEDYTIMLKPGTYTFMVKDTDKSFASKPVVVVVDYSVPSEYDIETDIEYNETTGMCSYSVKNNTGDDINAAGIVVVYDKSGILRHLEIINIFPSEGITKELDYGLQAGNTVKFIVWDSLQSIKPKDRVKLSEYIVTD